MRTKQDVSFCWRDLEPYPCWFMIWVCVMFRSKIAGITQFDDNVAQQKPLMVWYTKSPFCQDAEDRVGKIMQNSDDVRGIRHDSTLQTLHIWLVVWNMICFPCIYVYIYTYWECHNPNWLSLIFFGVGWNHQADIYTSQRRYNEGLTSKLLSTILGHLWIRVW
jgi:hypothetical protein